MNFKKFCDTFFALAVLVAVGYFFYLQFKNNADAIRAYHFTVNPYYIFHVIYFRKFWLSYRTFRLANLRK